MKIIKQLFKMKFIMWIFIIFILFGLFIFIHNCTTVTETLTTTAPVKQLTLITSEPIKYVIFYGGSDYFNLNSLLFFDTTGRQLQVGTDKDYTCNSSNGENPAGWPINDLMNNDRNKIDTYFLSWPGTTFTVTFHKPVNLREIYIRNRLKHKHNPKFNPTHVPDLNFENEIRNRLAAYKFKLVYQKNINNNLQNFEAMKTPHTLNDSPLFRGPNYDIVFQLEIPETDPLKIYKNKLDQAKNAKQNAHNTSGRATAEDRRSDAHHFRNTCIHKVLTEAESIKNNATTAKTQFDSYLGTLQSYANKTNFITTNVDFDSETSALYARDANLQISINNVNIDQSNANEIWNTIKQQSETINQNINAVKDVYSKIITCKQVILKQKENIKLLYNKLQEFNAIDNEYNTLQYFNITAIDGEINKYNGYVKTIDEYITEVSQTQQESYVVSIIDQATNIIDSINIAKANYKIAFDAAKFKNQIEKINITNEIDNEDYSDTIDRLPVEKTAVVPYAVDMYATTM